MSPARPGSLVISLDFELHWGVRDHVSPGATYQRQLLGAREVVPATLELFRRYEVAATWAVVGFLFARSRDELNRFRPRVLPTYDNPVLYPYDEAIGEDESSDPLHYASSLIELIRATPRQEVATHTFSHFFCSERGQTAEQFEADLGAARAIAAERGVELRSIVFPRNQHNVNYAEILGRNGIMAYRGNPSSWMWRFADGRESAGKLKRLARLTDAYLPLSGDGTFGWDEVPVGGGLADVRASFFVRPYARSLRSFEAIRSRRLRSAVASAARRRRILHLWWHPHNFGAAPAECLRIVQQVLEEFARCRDRWGMSSMTMAEVAEAALWRESTTLTTMAGPREHA